MIKRKTLHLTAIFLIGSMLSLMTLPFTVNASTLPPNVANWRPPSLDPNWVDPVTLKIREFKAQGLSDDQITGELTKVGMGWNPKTGATAIGVKSTPEELALMPPMRNPFEKTVNSMLKDYSVQTQYDAIYYPSYTWLGFGNNMKPGSSNVDEDEGPATRYITTHFGSSGTWTELGTHASVYNVAKHHYIYSYDYDEKINDDNFVWIYKSSWDSYDAYCIVMRGTQDGNGWWYDAYVNYQFVRSGHLANHSNGVDIANEACAWHGSGIADTVEAIFKDQYLRYDNSWQAWNSNIPSNGYATYPQVAWLTSGITCTWHSETHP